jgi:hypothetical protein
MVELLQDMAADTLGFRVSGRITRDECFEMLDPVRAKLERGEKVSFLVVTDDDFHGLELPALWEGRIFEPEELEHARAWVGGGSA